MMPEQTAAKHHAVRKKQKLARRKADVEQKVTDDKLTPASVSGNVGASDVAAKEKRKTDENVPAPSLPRIVIKICQGRIVSPSVSASSSTSSVGVKTDSSKCQSRGGLTGSQESKLADPAAPRTEKSDRMKTSPASKPAKAISGNKPNAKIAASQSSSSSKVLADRNSNAAVYFDSSQLQNSGSFDKLSLDCCMKLYGQLNQLQTSSQPLHSENAKSSKHTSMLKPCHKSSVRPSETTKRSADRVKPTASGHLPKIPAVCGSGNSVKVSAPRPPKCTVQLDRIGSVSDFSVSVCQSPAGSASQVNSRVTERMSFGREGELSGGVYDFGAVGDDNPTDDSCSVTLTPRTIDQCGDAPIQHTDIPSATETVPGSPLPLSRPRQLFSKRSHTPVDTGASRSGSPKKSRSANVASASNSSEKSRTSLLSSLLNSSVDDSSKSSAVKKHAGALPAADVTHLGCATDGGSLCRGVVVPGATAEIRNSSNSATELAIGSVSDVEYGRGSDASVCRKRGVPIDACNSGSSDVGSVSKKSRMLRIPGVASVESTVEPAESGVAEQTSDAYHPPPSPKTYIAAAASQSSDVVPEVLSVSELLSPAVDWGSRSHSPGADDPGSSPLRLRIRRLADDASPVTELYNVVGHVAGTESTPSAPCCMYQLSFYACRLLGLPSFNTVLFSSQRDST